MIHDTKEKLHNSILKFIEFGHKIDTILECYAHSFIMLEIDNRVDFVLNAIKEYNDKNKSMLLLFDKPEFSRDEMDYGTKTPKYTWDELSESEKAVLDNYKYDKD